MPKKSIADALKEYGYVGTLANSVPELKKLITQGADEGWDSNEFGRALQDSAWWKNQSNAVKKFTTLRATEPGEFYAQQKSTTSKIQAIAAEMGVSLVSRGDATLRQLVYGAMQGGWDEGELRRQIGAHWQFVRGQQALGNAGQASQKIRQLYDQYGVKASSDVIARATKSILMGKATLETVQAQVFQTARSTYQGLIPQLDSGQTVKDLADPYIQQMGQLLELSPDQVSLFDAKIQRALQNKGPDGKPAVQPLWQFQQDMRKDNRWDKTKNAAEAAYNFLGNVKSTWGL